MPRQVPSPWTRDYPPPSCRWCVRPVAPDGHVSSYRLASGPHRDRNRYPRNEWPFPRSHTTQSSTSCKYPQVLHSHIKVVSNYGKVVLPKAKKETIDAHARNYFFRRSDWLEIQHFPHASFVSRPYCIFELYRARRYTLVGRKIIDKLSVHH